MVARLTLDRFARFAWAVLCCNVLVVLWGAYVRASGSGAGCGSHWPLCNGAVVPRAPSAATLIEYSHRLTSGVALLLVLGLLLWSRRARPAGDPARTAAGAAMIFMITEALVGAGLVLLALVAKDASLRRVVALGVHLINTFLLLGALCLCAYFASGGRRPARSPRRLGALPWLVLLALLGTLVVSCAVAVTALGDTLFPARSLAEGLAQDASPLSHWLLRLRVVHPTLAVAVGVYLVIVSTVAAAGTDAAARRLGRLCLFLFLLQLGAGLLNITLLVPVPMQLVHLFLADLVWLALVLLLATAAGERLSQGPGVLGSGHVPAL